MPEMNGEEFYDRVLREYPAYALRVIFITGDSMGELTMRARSRKGPPVLDKTISTEELQSEINILLKKAAKQSPEFAF